MDDDKIQKLFHARALAEQEFEKLRSPITILFSDIKGSTAYFERKGDLDGVAMVQRHNDLLIPVIEQSGGRVVKTIGDAIMALFQEPVGAVRAAIGMQQALERDRVGRAHEEEIHIRVGLHMGLGLIRDNDVFGDVVNVASRVENQAQPDQILITEVLLDAAKTAGVQCARLGRAEIKGKTEPIDIYAVAWSASASDQLVDELQALFDRKLKNAKRLQEQVEEEFETSRDQWRAERRRLFGEIEKLEDVVKDAREEARQQTSEDFQSEIRFQLEAALTARQQAEQEQASAQFRWEVERTALKTHIAALQSSVIDTLEKSNNPLRIALAAREQVDVRLREARQDWDLEWDGERRRLNAEIEGLKKSSEVNERDEKQDVARHALLEKLGKLPPGSTASREKMVAQSDRVLQDARIRWETERDGMNAKLERAENELQRAKNASRNDAFNELRGQYLPRLAEAERERTRIEQELQSAAAQFNDERQRAADRIRELEQAIPRAQEAARRQVHAELKSDVESKTEELNRVKSRSERRVEDAGEESEAIRRQLRKQIAQLEEQLKEAKGVAYKAQRPGGRAPDA